MIAHDVLLTRFGLSERALHINDDIAPGQDLRQAGIGEDATERRVERLTSMAQARLALRAPPVAIGDQGVPVPHALENMMRLSG